VIGFPFKIRLIQLKFSTRWMIVGRDTLIPPFGQAIPDGGTVVCGESKVGSSTKPFSETAPFAGR